MKNIFKAGLLVLIFASLFTACQNNLGRENVNETNMIQMGRVTFFNESSYRVRIRRDVFSGPIVVELGSGVDRSQTVDIRISGTHGLGTTFSVEYLLSIPDSLLLDSDNSTDIFAIGHDFNVQINRVIEEGRHITIQIPQPQNLVSRSAFMAVKSTHNLPSTLFYFGQSIPQAGNGVLPITSGRTGIFTLNNLAVGGIPIGGKFEFRGFSIRSGLNVTPVPAFTAGNGYIYEFIFDGTSVVFSRQWPLIF